MGVLPYLKLFNCLPFGYQKVDQKVDQKGYLRYNGNQKGYLKG